MSYTIPVPDYCVVTQSYQEHISRAKANGWCYKPGTCPSGIYYYPGIDYAPDTEHKYYDVPITACTSGSVKEIIDESPKGYGLNIRQKADDDNLIIYAHLKKILVMPGFIINQGDKIAYMGNTGNSTGKHLHWEVRASGVPVDPMKFVDSESSPPAEPSPPISEFIIPEVPKLPQAIVRATLALRMRDSPGTNGIIVGALSYGAIVSIVDVYRTNGDVWFRVIRESPGTPIIGWSAAYYQGEVWLEVL